ncbi:Phage protein [Sodalis praecaptivus]|uniref:Phage protein n=1 Tax=Sodalis praecaptivus TaxID=1239307 RepID=W0HUP7_9GAMM|nr:phage virion morphogenesis protein [Sodalis praecaptivus]AHF77576.1 Phage protein [Sodalis praecaptivus]
MIRAELNKEQFQQLQGALKRLALPAPKRRRLLWRIAKYGVEAAAKRNVRNQCSPDGEAWPGRKTRRKGKMLRQMPKLIRIREMPAIDSVRLYLFGGHYRNAKGPLPAGVVGYVQQQGMKVTVKREQVTGAKQDDRAATRRQAKRLRKAGYQVRKGKRWRKPGYQEIEQNMSARQAGLLIRKLENKPVKTSWQIDLPARAFLGIGQDEFNKALARQLQAIGFGWDVNAQDIRGRS